MFGCRRIALCGIVIAETFDKGKWKRGYQITSVHVNDVHPDDVGYE